MTHAANAWSCLAAVTRATGRSEIFGSGTARLGNGLLVGPAAPSAVVAQTTSTLGFAGFPVPIRRTPALRGLDLEGQAVVVDPLGTGPGLAFSNGLSVGIGN
ncbi:MAG: hypothetical protein AAF628_35350 [Planctomycetota bacterium]